MSVCGCLKIYYLYEVLKDWVGVCIVWFVVFVDDVLDLIVVMLRLLFDSSFIVWDVNVLCFLLLWVDVVIVSSLLILLIKFWLCVIMFCVDIGICWFLIK